jgi:protein tyrosine/serine phosphatase
MPYSDRPHLNCYWVQPGRLIAGEYPGAFNEAQARQKLQLILEAGVTFFLDLTEPHELRPYADLVEEAAQARGITVEHRRLSVRDGDIPKSPQEMVKILDTIDEAIAAGHTVYVHCWGGIGRTGTVVGCHLVRHGKQGEEALQDIARWWQTIEKRHRHPRSPETEAQVDYILNWREP